MVLKEFEQKRSFKTRRYKVWSIKKKKNSEWCIAEDKAKNQKGLGPTLSLTTWQTHYKRLTFEPWFPFVKMGNNTQFLGFSLRVFI